MAESVGTELRRARERAHLSLEALSARTKIRVALLSAIEREQFDQVPAGLLTRGYLRAYAREVGLDPEAVVRQYVAEFELERLTPAQPPPEPHDTSWETEPGARTPWAILGPAIPLALAAIFFVRMNRPAETPRPVIPPPAATAGQHVEIAAVEQTVPATQTVAPEPEPLRLEIQPTAPTWIEATADGTRVLYEMVDAGARRSVEASGEMTLRVGDAGALTYSINGRPGRTLGGAGEVRDIRITRENFTEFLTE
ncbi:MAG: DUF4115 domain-containing protein [Acidobacteria bacterium]|nr:DUF4115 domain-containing protein [Acidobacteriota bacterium]